MTVPDEEVAQVRSATDIVALIGEHAALRRQGRRWVGLCPFHTEKTPSFSVNAEEGFYYCFGCQASGDAISFVRATEHLDFVGAVRLLADRAGVVLHESESRQGEHEGRRELFEAMERAVAWYHERLLSAPDAGRARDYLRSRGYDGETVRRFRLGWAPEGWDSLVRSLGLPERVLTGSGLAYRNRGGRLQDAFRARVLFPICDPSGRPVALGGRILPPPAGVAGPTGGGAGAAGGPARTEPKYKNSPETPIYAKRRTLYALNWAKHDIVASSEVVVCEGYTDVIACFAAGVRRAVATCGTALGEDHFRLLANFGRRVVLAYDADQAGQSATARVYEWERRHDVDVRVALLPDGRDPADLARSSPEALRAAMAGAVPFLQFRVDRILSSADLATAEGRARAAGAALAAVAEHPDDLVRDQYVMRVADRTRLDHTLVRQRLDEARRSPAPDGTRRRAQAIVADGPGRRERAPGAPRGGGARTVSRPGLEALRLAVHRPELVADRLEAVLFADDVQRRAFSALAAADDLRQAVDAAEAADPAVAGLLRRLVVEEPLAPDDPAADPADAVVAQLVREAVRRALGAAQARHRAERGDLATLARETATVRRWVEELDDPGRCREAAGRLVAWLLGATQEAG